MTERIFYVYEHWRPDRQVCFYVGKGSGYRASNLDAGRSRHHKNIIAKMLRLGMSVEIRVINDRLSDEEACAVERQRIAYWKANGVKLINLTDGGEGPAGRVVTKETRKKLSIAQKKALQHPQKAARILAGLARVHDQRMSSLRKTLADPKIRKKRSEIAKMLWMIPEIRKRRSKALKAAFARIRDDG